VYDISPKKLNDLYAKGKESVGQYWDILA
jgi:hypothetical protein